MKYIKWLQLLIGGMLFSNTTGAQFVVGTKGITVKAGTTLSVDSLILTPTADHTLYSNSLTTSYSSSSGTGAASINRVYSFASPLYNYSGNIGMQYANSELNGNYGPWLAMVYTTDNVVWKANRSGSSASNFVQSGGGLTNDTLLSITAINCVNFYSKNIGDLTLTSSWGTNADGSGLNPPGFSSPMNSFIVCNRSGTVSLLNDWTVKGLLTINAGIDLAVGSHALTVSNVTCNGTIGGNSTSSLTIKGTVSPIHFTTGANTFGTVLLDSNSMVTLTDTLNLAAGGAPGTLAVTYSGLLNAGGYLRLLSDSLGTARIGAVTGAITGNVMCMQYVRGGRRAYRFWAHPFSSGIPLSQIKNYIDITGTGGASNGFTTTASNAPSSYRYNPLVGNSALSSDPGWRPFTSAYGTGDSNLLHPYQGIRLFVRGAIGEGLYYVTSYSPSPVTIGMYGHVNQGNLSVPLSKGSGSNQDFNMVGNPYPSPVDIGTVIYNARTEGSIAGAAFYVWVPTMGPGGQFLAIPIGTASANPYYLQANCAVQVRAAHNGDALHFTENDKSANISNSLMRTLPEYVVLKIYDTNYHLWDMFSLKFNNSATESEDDYDAIKPPGQDFNFYSLSSENHKLAMDVRPYKVDKIIPLGIASSYTQDFIIKVEGMDIPGGGQLYLRDKLLKQNILLEQGTEYKFTITADKATQGDSRFELGINEAAAITQSGTTFKFNLSPNPATEEIAVSFINPGNDDVNLRIVDMGGVCVVNNHIGLKQSGTAKVKLDGFAAGMYIVELSSGNKKISEKFIKQ